MARHSTLFYLNLFGEHVTWLMFLLIVFVGLVLTWYMGYCALMRSFYEPELDEQRQQQSVPGPSGE